MSSASLNATRRACELDTLASSGWVDVLVIGAGVTGAGVALDAAARGLSTALVDKHDLAFGTSRWSSKLVHGGLRYLATGRLGVAYQSAVERDILLRRTAPHLVRPFPQLVPLLPQMSATHAATLRAGYLAGDTLRRLAGTSGRRLPHSRHITPAETQRHAPTVRVAGLRGGILGWDCQLHDDARLVVALARTAASFGARVLTRCAVEKATGDGATVVDQLTQHRFQVSARVVINATGVWASQLAPQIPLRPSRGSHLIFDQQLFGGLSAGLTAPVPGERNRFVFALPAPDNRVLVGLTDEEAPGEIPDVPHPNQSEIDFLISAINSVLRAPVSRRDLLGSYAGLRPLLESDGRTADLSRQHAVFVSRDGLVTVIGGKLTTYRRMAQDALDVALRRRGVTAGPCRTQRLPLVGAVGWQRTSAPERLLRRYGSEAPAVLAEAQGDPELLAPIDHGIDTTGAELRFAVRHEGALDVADLLDRRTRIGLVAADRERAIAQAENALSLGVHGVKPNVPSS